MLQIIQSHQNILASFSMKCEKEAFLQMSKKFSFLTFHLGHLTFFLSRIRDVEWALFWFVQIEFKLHKSCLPPSQTSKEFYEYESDTLRTQRKVKPTTEISTYARHFKLMRIMLNQNLVTLNERFSFDSVSAMHWWNNEILKPNYEKKIWFSPVSFLYRIKYL